MALSTSSMPLTDKAQSPRTAQDYAIATALLLYVAVVHIADAIGLNSPFNGAIDNLPLVHTLSRWNFDLFKFLVWFLIPFVFLLALRRIDWFYFGFRRWQRRDRIVLAGLTAVGLIAVLSIRFIPSLQEWYPALGKLPPAAKWRLATERLVWTLSWIIGWEFIHRYALLTQLSRAWPRYGWLLIPVIEGLYHLQKDPLEMIGMVVFSLILTSWALLRRNTLLPFLAHLAIELELLAFQLLA